MKLRLTAKTLVALAFVGFAGAAMADSFSVVESGSYSQTGLALTLGTTTTTTLQSSLPQGVTSAIVSFTEAAAPTPAGVGITGDFVVTGATAADTMTFDFTGSAFSGATVSLAASATLVGATGAYSAYTSGVGNLAFQLVQVGDRHLAVGTISGDVQSVPEPISLATLGVGLFGLAVRKKRS